MKRSYDATTLQPSEFFSIEMPIEKNPYNTYSPALLDSDLKRNPLEMMGTLDLDVEKHTYQLSK